MSGILNSGVNGSTSTFPDAPGRAYTAAFSSQLGSSAADMNHNDAIGLRGINGNYNIPSMPGAYTSRNSGLNGPLNGVQTPTGSLSNGRYAVNNLPVALSQQSAASSLGLSGISNNGGSGLGNREQIISSMAMGNLVNGGNIGRSLSSSGLNMLGVASRLNLTAPQMVSLLGNSYSGGGGPLSQNQFQGGNSHLSSMALLSELNRDHSFDMNDFPQLSGHLSSAGGSQRQLGGMARRQNVGFMQQNQEFSIQNEDFPALPGYKGGNEFSVNMHQKEQLRDNAVSMMQSQQHLPVGRSAVFSLGGGAYSSHQQQQQHAPISGGASYLPANSQDLHFHGSEARNSGMLATGSRPVNLSNTVSGGGGSYDQLMQQYQHFQKQSQIRLASPFRDQDLKSPQLSQSVSDRFGLLGLLNVIRMNNPDLTPLALGIDLMTLGLNLNSSDNLYKKFSSPWSDESAKGEPHYAIPECFNTKQPAALNQDSFSRFSPETLFYIFYSMPKDEAQLFAANELHNRGWFYHRELRIWLSRAPNTELIKSPAYERGCFYCFDPNTWETIRKDNFLVQYEMVEDRPVVPRR